jgi:hypothetical protein
MAGYFSQLAKNTGLTLGHEAPVAKASGKAPESGSSQTHGGLQPPLGIDEVAFIAPPAAEPQPLHMTAKGPELVIETSTSLPLEGRSAEPGSEPQSSKTVTAEVSDSQTSAAALGDPGSRDPDGEFRIGTANSRVGASDSPANLTASISVHEQHSTQAAPDDESARSFESRVDPDVQSATKPREHNTVSVAQREKLVTTLLGEAPEETEQVTTMRDYLKEVLAWVAATPERDELQGSSLTTQPAISERIEIQAKDEISSPAQPAMIEPMVQDLNLSIGNISIVVEEPRQNVAAQVVAPLRNERSSERATSEPTRLSRYYVRSW